MPRLDLGRSSLLILRLLCWVPMVRIFGSCADGRRQGAFGAVSQVDERSSLEGPMREATSQLTHRAASSAAGSCERAHVAPAG